MGQITVVITTVGAPRAHLLPRAVASVEAQIRPPDRIVISTDTERRGAAHNRQAGTDQVETDLVAYLDDDDEFYPEHLALLEDHLEETGSDLVYPWFDVVGGADPFPMHFGQPWNPDRPVQFPVTYLARVEPIRQAGGWVPIPEGAVHADGNRAGEDWDLQMRLLTAGAKIRHLPLRTWLWHHDSGNTSGLPGWVQW